MGRGPNRKKILVETSVGRNKSVIVRLWTDEDTIDIAYPDRKQTGFYLKQVKGIRLCDAEGIRKCLNDLHEQGFLK